LMDYRLAAKRNARKKARNTWGLSGTATFDARN